MNDRTPWLTVVTVCYNSEKTIKKTIESVGPQLTEEVEYLIVDGKSKDETLSIIDKAQETFPIRVVSEKDSGIYDAMNKAIRLASGKWLLFINSDDCLKPGILKKMLPVLKTKEQHGCICTDVEMVRQIGEKRYSRLWKCEEPASKIKWYLTGCHQGMYLKKDVLEDIGGFDTDFPVVADWDLLYRIYAAKHEILCVHEVTAEFLEGGASKKQPVWEKHLVRRKNRMYRLIDLGLLRDGYKRLKSEIASILLGKHKSKLVAKRKYEESEI